ncbi:hypothetical protein AWQ22_00850 [Picosynechococcus sp. PCC 7117]|nr:hypothetical protein AWQ22_00850 [Picosynechococcus sp. PCC 7117]
MIDQKYIFSTAIAIPTIRNFPKKSKQKPPPSLVGALANHYLFSFTVKAIIFSQLSPKTQTVINR